MQKMLEDSLRSVEWDEDLLATRYLPSLPRGESPGRIVIDPQISFGRPVIQPGGISTAVIVARVDAGEDLEQIADDYDLDLKAIEEAVVYERAA